jgi:hypothetical protein
MSFGQKRNQFRFKQGFAHCNKLMQYGVAVVRVSQLSVAYIGFNEDNKSIHVVAGERRGVWKSKKPSVQGRL